MARQSLFPSQPLLHYRHGPYPFTRWAAELQHVGAAQVMGAVVSSGPRKPPASMSMLSGVSSFSNEVVRGTQRKRGITSGAHAFHPHEAIDEGAVGWDVEGFGPGARMAAPGRQRQVVMPTESPAFGGGHGALATPPDRCRPDTLSIHRASKPSPAA